MGKRCELPVKERREAVLSLLRREELGAVIALRYAVSEASLYRWRDEFLAAGEAALAGGTQMALLPAIDKLLSSSNRSRTRSGHWRADGRQPNFKKTLGTVPLNAETRSVISEELTGMQAVPPPRRVQVLKLVGVAPSSGTGRR